MSKNNEDIKQAMETIDVPAKQLDQAILAGIKQAKAGRKQLRKRLYPYVAAASAALFLMVGSAFVSPAMARVLSTVPVLDSVFEFTGDMGLVIASKRGLQQGVGHTSTDQGISLTIEDVYYDGTRLSISYLEEMHGNPGFIAEGKHMDHLGELQLFADGKEINFSDSRSVRQLSDHTYAGVVNISSIGELPDSFELKMGIKEIVDTSGSWEFTIPVEMAKEEVKTFASGETVVYKDQVITVNDVKIGAAGTKLSLTIESPELNTLQMVDGQLLQFNLLDDQGHALTLLDAFGTGDIRSGDGPYSMEMEYRYEPVAEDIKELTVSPFLVPVDTGAPEQVRTPLEADRLPLVIDQGTMGSIIVKSLRHEDDKMVLTFESASDFPFDGHFQYNTLWLEDADGNNLTAQAKGYPERIRPHVYEQEFQAADGPLTLVTFMMNELKVLQGSEVVIPIH